MITFQKNPTGGWAFAFKNGNEVGTLFDDGVFRLSGAIVQLAPPDLRQIADHLDELSGRHEPREEK